MSVFRTFVCMIPITLKEEVKEGDDGEEEKDWEEKEEDIKGG